jgi:16S rRNA processing protein RimM
LPDNKSVPSGDQNSLSKEHFDTRAGIVVGAHGIQGTVKVKPLTTTSSRLFTPSGSKDLAVWLSSNDAFGRAVSVVSAKRQQPKDIYLLRLRGIDDRTSAEQLVGYYISGNGKDRAELSEDEYFVEDLIGLKIVDKNQQDLGILAVVHNGVANDVYETDRGLLIPAVKAFVDSIDLAKRTITVVDADALAME